MSAFCKPLFSGALTKYENVIPKYFKFALIFNLLHRAFKLCSGFKLNYIITKNYIIWNCYLEIMVTQSVLLIYVLKNTWKGYMPIEMQFY